MPLPTSFPGRYHAPHQWGGENYSASARAIILPRGLCK
jgi:hypothetical protein